MIILDTNVLSELMRPNPDAAVLEWLRRQSLRDIGTTSVNIAEIRYGLARLSAGRRKQDLETRFDNFVTRGLANRVFDFDAPSAEAYGDLMIIREKIGRRLEGFDGLIAAIARSRNASVATRNVGDFNECGLDVVNPWDLR